MVLLARLEEQSWRAGYDAALLDVERAILGGHLFEWLRELLNERDASDRSRPMD